MLKSSLATVAASVTMALVGLASAAITARALGVEGRGVLAAALVTLSLARGAGQLGLGQSFSLLVRRGQLSKPGKYALVSSGVVAIGGGAVAAGIIAIAPVTEDRIFVYCILMAAAVATIADFQVNALRIQSSLKAYNYARVLYPTFTTLLVAGVWWKLGYLTPMHVIVSSIVAATFLIFGVGLALSRLGAAHRSSPGASKGSLRRYRNTAVSYQGLAVIGLIINNIDMLYLMFKGNAATFGLYAAAFGLSRIVSPVPMAVGNALYARFAGASPEGGAAVATSLLVFRVLTPPLFAVCCIGALISPWAVPAVLGDQFKHAWPAFSVLLFEGAMGGMAFLLAQHFQAEGRVNVVLKRHLASIVPTLLLIWFIPQGNTGLGLACLILLSSFIRLLVTVRQFRVLYDLPRIRWFAGRSDVQKLRSL